MIIASLLAKGAGIVIVAIVISILSRSLRPSQAPW
jgi:hypothetical protein